MTPRPQSANPFRMTNTLSDPAERKALAQKIQLRAVETVPYVPIGLQYQIRAHRAGITDILAPPAPVYWNLRKP